MKREQIFRRKWLPLFCVTVLAVWGLFSSIKARTYAAPEYILSEAEIRQGTEISGKGLLKKIPLNAETVTQIPRYIMEGNAAYILDEAKITIEETGYGSSEGADVVTASRKIEKLPDNDLARIEKSIIHDGIPCDLLCVVYEITEKDKLGIPKEYAAVCEYGGLKKYSRSYPSSWQAIVCYDVYQIEDAAPITVQYEESKSGHTLRHGVIKQPEEAEKAENETEKKSSPVLSQKKLTEKSLERKEIKQTEDKKELWIPILALAAAAGLLGAWIHYFTNMTAPLYALTAAGKYHYIGQISIKKKKKIYLANLTNRLISKAELPSFKIKIPEKMKKRKEKELFSVKCPDGKIITTTFCSEILFDVE